MNQNETKPLTADQTLRKWCEYTYPSLPDAAKMALQTACLSYAAQQVKQVTEERDKLQYSNEILAKSYHRLTSERDTAVELLQQLLNGEMGAFLYPSEKRQITGFLNSLNAGREGGE